MKKESLMFKLAQKILKQEDKFLAYEKKVKETAKAVKDETIKLKESVKKAKAEAHLSDKMKKGLKLANDHRRTFLTEKKKTRGSGFSKKKKVKPRKNHE